MRYFALIVFKLFLLITTSIMLSACGSGGGGDDEASGTQNSDTQSLGDSSTNSDNDSSSGDSSNNDSSSGDSSSSSANSTVYIAVRAINYNGESSSYSNEASTIISADSDIRVSFTEPVEQMDGNCLTSQIEKYVIHYGNESGNYGESIEVASNSVQLNCTVVSTHASCGDVSNCTVDVSV